VDALSGATRNYSETRNDLNFSVARRMGETQVRPAYIRSQENDYLSETFKLDLEQDLFSRNTTLSLGVRHLSDSIRPSWSQGPSQSLLTNALSLGLSQVLTRLTVLRLGFDFADYEGLLSNPYAFVQIGNATASPMPESTPDWRQRSDLSASLKQALPWDASFEFWYRYYQDTWDVHAHTLQASMAQQLGPLVVEASGRYYVQNAAYFFKNFYTQVEPFMSRDLKLADFSTTMLSLALRGELAEGWSGELRYSRLSRQDNLDYRLYFADSPLQADLWSIGLTFQ
jgi:hypothetical protein